VDDTVETIEHEEREPDPEAEARRYVALAQIRQYPDPVLRMPAREVEVFDGDLEQLFSRMARLMQDANGVGLAATQIGVLRRLLVYREAADAEPVALANPQIVARSEETEVDDEGCLSLQGVLVPVERHVAVTVQARNPAGEERRVELQGVAARACQHEIDHLDGILILERTTPEARRDALRTLRPHPVLGARA
jgi:peptide deformylase